VDYWRVCLPSDVTPNAMGASRHEPRARLAHADHPRTIGELSSAGTKVAGARGLGQTGAGPNTKRRVLQLQCTRYRKPGFLSAGMTFMQVVHRVEGGIPSAASGNAEIPLDLARVSVIIPCYNQGAFLADALDSVFAQTYSSWDCIVVDDGSFDETEAVAREYCERDKRLVYVRKTNGGLSSARNAGLERAQGHYIQFLDADDLILPHKLELQMAVLAKATRDAICITGFRWASGTHASILHPTNALNDPSFRTSDRQKEVIQRWEIDLAIPIHCFLITRLVFDRGLRFDETLPGHEDWDFWIRMFNVPVEVYLVREPLAIYRDHRDSMTRNPAKMWEGFKRVYEKHMQELRDRPDLVDALRQKRKTMSKVYGRKRIKYQLMQTFPGLVAFYKSRVPQGVQSSIRRLL
jgi:glycosyltransferase involved in cell wall biosynthesis